MGKVRTVENLKRKEKGEKHRSEHLPFSDKEPHQSLIKTSKKKHLPQSLPDDKCSTRKRIPIVLEDDQKRMHKIRKLNQTVVFKKRRFLHLAISKITGKPLGSEKGKQKKNTSQMYPITPSEESMKKVMRMCKSNYDKVTCQETIPSMSGKELSSAMCHFMLKHEWNKAAQCLHTMIQHGCHTVGSDDAEMKSLFAFALNHPDRKLDFLLSLVPVMLKSNDEADKKKFLADLLHLPEKLEYPYVFEANEVSDTKNLSTFFRNKKGIKYDGSDSD
nr:PREDICTED: uncharacterized protein LOC109041226 [Bemisia tabaci]